MDFGLKIVERDPSTKVVVSVSCLFCVHFGREEKVGAKRRKTTNVQYFKKPFRVDAYKQHMIHQHPERWKEYSAMSKDDKALYFDKNAVKHINSIRSHFRGTQIPLHCHVDKKIVDTIIAEMLFHLDDGNDEVTLERALSIFKVNEDDTRYYSIEIKNRVQFDLAVDYLRVGSTFRMASRIVTMTKERTGLASIGSYSEDKVASYARFVCAMNLQQLSDAIEGSWTFSIGIDMSTHQSTSY